MAIECMFTRALAGVLTIGIAIGSGCSLSHEGADATEHKDEWPRDACHNIDGADDLPLVPLRSDHVLAEAPVAALNRQGSTPLRWSDGVSTSVDLQARQTGTGCTTRPAGGSPVFIYPVKLDVKTHDERMSAQLDGTLWVVPEGDVNLPSVAVLQTKTGFESKADLQTKTGLSGIDFVGFESVALRCSVYYAPNDGVAEGQVELIGESLGDDCDAAGSECGANALLTGMFNSSKSAD